MALETSHLAVKEMAILCRQCLILQCSGFNKFLKENLKATAWEATNIVEMCQRHFKVALGISCITCTFYGLNIIQLLNSLCINNKIWKTILM